jgi:hypothetical protein
LRRYRGVNLQPFSRRTLNSPQATHKNFNSGSTNSWSTLDTQNELTSLYQGAGVSKTRLEHLNSGRAYRSLRHLIPKVSLNFSRDICQVNNILTKRDPGVVPVSITTVKASKVFAPLTSHAKALYRCSQPWPRRQRFRALHPKTISNQRALDRTSLAMKKRNMKNHQQAVLHGNL